MTEIGEARGRRYRDSVAPVQGLLPYWMGIPEFRFAALRALVRTPLQGWKTRRALLLFLFQVGLEKLFAAADRGHETHAIALLHGAGPAFHLHKTPVGKIFDAAAFGIGFGGKEEELHSFFGQPDLGDPMDIFVIENTGPQGFEFSELRRHVVMLEPVLQEKEIAQGARVGFERIQHD